MNEDDLPSPAPVRRRDAAATRASILLAAREVFTRLGYDGAGVREIARAADVDTRLIGRYFGSKEGLFAEVVDLAYQKSLMMTPDVTDEAARALLTGEDEAASDGLLLTLRSASNARAAAIMRASIEGDYQRKLADALPGADADARAALLVSICSGVLLSRMLLGNTLMNGPDVEELVPYLRAALDAVARDPAEGVRPPD
ncbi:helix-turn-helix domain-containing protein [Streptomyces liangshanensis]|uniref:helix-turn-helix domain-containing protein n=1 Tax=Streptomyces liangshanensis TaxID=2717324 RepID=UPI0036D7E438